MTSEKDGYKFSLIFCFETAVCAVERFVKDCKEGLNKIEEINKITEKRR